MTKEYQEFKSQFTRVETLFESSHKDYYLMQDKDGSLWLYEFYEYVDFSHGNDQIYETYSKVVDLEDAKSLMKSGDARRSPYVRINPDYTIKKG